MHGRFRTPFSINVRTGVNALTGAARTTLAPALDIGLRPAPPPGRNIWNTFGRTLGDGLIRGLADALGPSDMTDAGYEYINVDGWSVMQRNSSDNLVSDPVKFPNGMKAVADYGYGKGLKFGIYTEAGTTTCSGYPGGLGPKYRTRNRSPSAESPARSADRPGTTGQRGRGVVAWTRPQPRSLRMAARAQAGCGGGGPIR
ncbi:MAG: hypothetical protein HKP61_23735 [Dactylosporangium sp.]|nr:hypothetical protein [Dactylosporangium sp.]NNJ63892.1 hypothetical protein [Dactylosporangium sp.]